MRNSRLAYLILEGNKMPRNGKPGKSPTDSIKELDDRQHPQKHWTIQKVKVTQLKHGQKDFFTILLFRCAVASLYEVVSVRRSVRPSVPCYFRR